MAFEYGAVLKIQREFTYEDIFSKMDAMKRMGMNIIAVWPAVYWWEDRSHSDYPFHTGHEILNYAEKIDLKIIMETAGQLTSLEYAPDFVMKEEYYATKKEGNPDKLEGHNYKYVNYNHPEVKQLIKKQYMQIAEQYKGYKSLYGYDIWNETMFTSYDHYTLKVFRNWLEEKYQTIERLNDVWDRCFYDWSQIQFDNWLWASVMPKVDYEQFHKQNIGIILKEWSDIIKSVDNKRPVIADNVSSMLTTLESYDRPQDDWNLADNVDEIGFSFYPKNNNPIVDYRRWLDFIGMHSASKDGTFWISEMQTHHMSMFTPQTYVHPHELRWWNWEAISHGAKGIVYWKFDPFIKGVQTFGRGLVDLKGNYTDRGREATSIRKIISKHEREFVDYKPETPQVAIFYDRLNHDFTKAYTLKYEPKVSSNIYLDSIAGLCKLLWNNNIAYKFVTPEDLIAGNANQYKMLFMTNQLNMNNSLSAAIKTYVTNGGVLVSDGKFAEVDDDSVLYNEMPGAGLSKAFGFEILDNYPDDLDITLKADSIEDRLPGYFEKRLLNTFDNKINIKGIYDNGDPAILSIPHGKGEVVYLSTMLWYGYLINEHDSVNEFIKKLDKNFSLHLHSVNDNTIKLSTLKGDDGYLVFAFNYQNKMVDTEVQLKSCENGKYQITNLYTDERINKEISMNECQLSVSLKENETAVILMKRID